MEALEKALARESSAKARGNFDPVQVSSVTGIKQLVAEFDPNKNPRHPEKPLSARLEVQEGGKNQTYQVDTRTRSKSKREILLEGLDVIKKRIERKNVDVKPVLINGHDVRPAAIGDGIAGHSWVDALIKQWLGGYRDGLLICWDLPDGYKYKYDIYEHKLTRVQR